LGRAQRGPASGWEQPPPVEPTRKRRLNASLHSFLIPRAE